MRNDERILEEIEKIVSDFLRQLCRRNPNVSSHLVLGIRADVCKLRYGPRNLMKLARDLTAMAKIHELVVTKRKATKRDIFYDDKLLYGEQRHSDSAITNVCALLGLKRHELPVTSCSRGVIQGCLSFLNPTTGALIDCNSGPIPITEELHAFRPLTTADFILVVEKDATFQRLIDADYFKHYPQSILMTGKGYPDLCSRRLLSWLVDTAHLPIYGLFDADPHGIEIYLTYKYGSSKDAAESRDIYVKSIRWLGLRPTDMLSISVPSNQLLPLSDSDYSKMRKVRHRAKQLGEMDVVNEIDALTKLGGKYELEVLTGGGGSGCGGDYIVRCYLAKQLKRLRSSPPEMAFKVESSDLLSQAEDSTQGSSLWSSQSTSYYGKSSQSSDFYSQSNDLFSQPESLGSQRSSYYANSQSQSQSYFTDFASLASELED